MMRVLHDRPPTTIRIEQLNRAQWEAYSDAGDFCSGIQDVVTAISIAIEWADFYGDAVVLQPYLEDRLLLLRPTSRLAINGRRA